MSSINNRTYYFNSPNQDDYKNAIDTIKFVYLKQR